MYVGSEYRMNRMKWKRRIKKKIEKYYNEFGYPELLKLTKIETLSKRNEFHTGTASWYGYYDLGKEEYFFDEIIIGIHSNLEDESENLVVLHETTHVIHRLELKEQIYPFHDHTNQFFKITERIDPDFRINNEKQKYYRR